MEEGRPIGRPNRLSGYKADGERDQHEGDQWNRQPSRQSPRGFRRPHRCSPFYASVESTTASGCLPGTYVTSVTPIMWRACSSGIFIGPGAGALPGAGCGNAVDIAVWTATWPSTFWTTWWMWPLSTVTDPK